MSEWVILLRLRRGAVRAAVCRILGMEASGASVGRLLEYSYTALTG